MDSKFRSRKFLLVLLVYAAATALTALGTISGAEITGIYMTLVGAYSLANVLAKKKTDSE